MKPAKRSRSDTAVISGDWKPHSCGGRRRGRELRSPFSPLPAASQTSQALRLPLEPPPSPPPAGARHPPLAPPAPPRPPRPDRVRRGSGLRARVRGQGRFPRLGAPATGSSRARRSLARPGPGRSPPRDRSRLLSRRDLVGVRLGGGRVEVGCCQVWVAPRSARGPAHLPLRWWTSTWTVGASATQGSACFRSPTASSMAPPPRAERTGPDRGRRRPSPRAAATAAASARSLSPPPRPRFELAARSVPPPDPEAPAPAGGSFPVSAPASGAIPQAPRQGGRRTGARARRPRCGRARCCPRRRRHGQEAQEA